MKTKVIETRLVPKGGVAAITLFGLVFTRDKRLVTPRVLNHELIHCAQQLEMLYVPFFLVYFIEWIWKIIKYRSWDKAYRALSMEREAYANDGDMQYLRRRRPYSWLRYLGKKRPKARNQQK